MQKLLCKSKNGAIVTYDPVSSHAAPHLADTSQLIGLVREIVSSMNLDGQEIKQHFNMGRVVGICDVVEVNDNDEIVYGVRRNREDDGQIPFTKTTPAKPCQEVAVHILPQNDGTYILSSAWIGIFDNDDEPFPQSANATERSIEYWERWAFVYGSQEILPGTETTIRPW